MHATSHLRAWDALLACIRPAHDGRARYLQNCITPTGVGCAPRSLRPASDGRARCRDACRITNPLSRRVPLAYLALPATAGLAARMHHTTSHTYALVGCAARLLRPAATAELDAQMHAASHTYYSVGTATEMHAASTHTYSRRVRCSLTSLCLLRQGLLPRCLHHTYPRRVLC